MQLKIKDVIVPSENQIKVGILGTVSIEIIGANNLPVVTVSNITVRKNKNSEMFLSMPSYKNGEKYYNYVDLFRLSDDEATNNTQKNLRAELTKEVLRILESGGTRKPTNKPVATSTTSKTNFPWEKNI